MLVAAGGITLLALPLPWPVRLGLTVSWWVAGGVDAWRHRSRYRRVAGYRLYGDGSIDIEAPDGARTSGEIAAGTVSLAGHAWLRCRASDGGLFAEFLARNGQERDEWRRFRVICRHVRAC